MPTDPLALRQPAATSYEPFSTLFSLAGGFFPWMLLVIILFASLVIHRPFCAYLCPIGPIIEFIGRVRGWLLERWSRNRAPRPARRQATQPLLIVLVAVCVLLIIINVSMALRQNGSEVSHFAADVYTLETDTP